MFTWRRGVFVAAALVSAGCTAKIEGPAVGGPGTGTGPNGTPSQGSGAGKGVGSSGGNANGSGGNGSGASSSSSGGNTNGTSGSTSDPGNPVASRCVNGVPTTSQLPRLTHVEYDNTIRDLVGLSMQPSSMLAPDTNGSVDQRAWDGYQAAADAVSGAVVADAAARQKAVGCATGGTDDTACITQFVTSFGQKAFRRPLTAAEVTKFTSIYTNRATVTATGTADEAVQLILRSFLLSPSFLTKAETSEAQTDGKIALSPYEIATRLSYMIWSSAPDDALLDAAKNGALNDSAGVLKQAQRMVADPKARSMVGAFHNAYAKMGEGTRWVGYQREQKYYAGFTDASVTAASAETAKFFDYTVFDAKGTFHDLLTSTVGFVNSSLASVYGLSGSFGAELVKTDLDPATRPGVFTRAGFLAAYSLFDRSSPILRGAFLQKQVLCTDIGAPPPDAASTPVPTDPNLKTNRARTDAQTSGAACAGCHHSLINPTGFALETFDAIGAVQSKEHDNGAPIDATATVPINETETVDVVGPAELMNAIADSREAQACYARRWVEFAYQRAATAQDYCTVETLSTKLTDSGYKVVDLIADLTQSQYFRYRAVEVTQ
jgi:hypothetical protein